MNDLPVAFDIEEDVETHELLPPGKYTVHIHTLKSSRVTKHFG
jgi:hypothetical protein